MPNTPISHHNLLERGLWVERDVKDPFLIFQKNVPEHSKIYVEMNSSIENDEMMNFVELYWNVDDGSEVDLDFREFDINWVIPLKIDRKIDSKLDIWTFKIICQKSNWSENIINSTFPSILHWTLPAISKWNSTFPMHRWHWAHFCLYEIRIQFRSGCEKLIENALFRALKYNK